MLQVNHWDICQSLGTEVYISKAFRLMLQPILRELLTLPNVCTRLFYVLEEVFMWVQFQVGKDTGNMEVAWKDGLW